MRGRASIVLLAAFGLSCTFGSGGGAAVSDGSETSAADGGADTAVATTAAMTTTTPDGDGDGSSGAVNGTTGGGSSDGATTTTGATDSSDSGDGSDASDSSDSGDTTGGPTDAFGPFGPPVAIDVLNDAMMDDDDPTLRSDELELYFNSNRSGTPRIWVSRRADLGTMWDPPQVDEDLSSFDADTTPEMSDDGLVMLLSSTRDGSGSHDPFIATRADFESPWSTPVRLDDLSTPAIELGPTLVDDALYMCRSFNLNTQLELLRFDVIDLEAGMFGPPQQLMTIDGDGDECTAHVSQDGLELFVERRGSGKAIGNPGFEIERATRQTVDDDWSAPTSVDALNADVDDNDPFVGSTGERLYFASFRDGGVSNLYMAERSAL